jgi:hypothetical protein
MTVPCSPRSLTYSLPGTFLQIRVTTSAGETLERFPAYTLRATQNAPKEYNFRARMETLPPVYRGVRPPKPKTPKSVPSVMTLVSDQPLTPTLRGLQDLRGTHRRSD